MSNPQFTTSQQISQGQCHVCGHPLYLTDRHIGGHPNRVDFIACSNPDGGETHLLVRIDERDARAYRQYARERSIDAANAAWCERLEREQTGEVV